MIIMSPRLLTFTYMCQPGSRSVPVRHERAADPREIFGDGSGRLEGSRTPVKGPGIAAKGPVGVIGRAAGDRAREVLGGTPASIPVAAAPVTPVSAPASVARPRSSINGMPPIAPVAGSTTASSDVRAKVDSAVAAIRQEVGPVAKLPERVPVRDLQQPVNVILPSVVEFNGSPVQKQLARDFFVICRDADSLPAGRENRDARREIRARLCFRMQRALGLPYVHGDKKRFAGAVRDELIKRLPSGTDVMSMLPGFMKEWLDGKNSD